MVVEVVMADVSDRFDVEPASDVTEVEA